MRLNERKGRKVIVEAKRMDGSWSDGCCFCDTSALGQISVLPSHAWSPVSPRDEAPDFWVRQPSSATCWLCSSGQVAWALWALVSLLVSRDKMCSGCEQWIQPCMMRSPRARCGAGQVTMRGRWGSHLGSWCLFRLKCLAPSEEYAQCWGSRLVVFSASLSGIPLFPVHIHMACPPCPPGFYSECQPSLPLTPLFPSLLLQASALTPVLVLDMDSSLLSYFWVPVSVNYDICLDQ